MEIVFVFDRHSQAIEEIQDIFHLCHYYLLNGRFAVKIYGQTLTILIQQEF